MGRFLQDELIDGHPTCDGLRRVTEELIGPIVERTITHLVPLGQLNENNTGAVAVKVVVQPRTFDFERNQISEESIADINKQNTELKYLIHGLATAETRSEARALRKILRLRKVIAAEEVTEISDEKLQDIIPWQPSEPISDEQKNVIDLLAKRLNIDVMKFINMGKNHYDSINEVTKEIAASMLAHLNKVQRSLVEVPKHILGYKQDWNN